METYSFSMELQKMLIDWLRKQGGNVVILSTGIVFLWQWQGAQAAELKSTIAKQDEKIEAQIEEIRKCDTERARLESRVEWLVSELSRRFPRLKNEYNER